MQKYLGSYYFDIGNFLVKFNKSWKLKYINWNYDKVMSKAYRWSLFIGPIEIKRYKQEMGPVRPQPQPKPRPRLFDDKFVYPCDENGSFIECEGPITNVDEFKVTVKTEHGSFDGYVSGYLCGKIGPDCIGKIAKIRIYEQGVGWYPDYKIMGWRN